MGLPQWAPFGYMSPPEQADGRPDDLGVTSDIYSLGATLYHLLVGRASIRTEDRRRYVRDIADWTIPPAREVNPAVPAALEAICQTAMALRPIDRYQTALELADDVEHWLADEPVAAYADPWTIRCSRWSRRHRTGLVAAAVLLISAVVALSVTTGLVWRKEQEVVQEKRIALENYDIAKTLSFGGIELIKLSEAEVASIPSLQSARKKILQGAALAFRKYLEQDPSNADLQRRTAEVYRYTANVQSFSNDTGKADALYRDSIQLQEKLAAEFQNEARFSLSLAETLRDYSQLQAKVTASRRQSVAGPRCRNSRGPTLGTSCQLRMLPGSGHRGARPLWDRIRDGQNGPVGKNRVTCGPVVWAPYPWAKHNLTTRS